MTTYLIQPTPKFATQDTWAVSFSLPYIAESYARAGENVWYVKTWLTAEQIRRRLAILFDEGDELLIHELRREDHSAARLTWLEGRLEQDEDADAGFFNGPRVLWGAIQSAVQSWSSQPLSPQTLIPPAFMVGGNRAPRAA